MWKGKENQKYTPESKKLVVETMHTQHLEYVEAQGFIYDISDKRIQDWECIYLAEGPEGLDIGGPITEARILTDPTAHNCTAASCHLLLPQEADAKDR